ncbi:MAG: hypothetical protein LBK61_12435 [Spirochaetaceae bacterium]|jgi:hypothetical protein|nr:hypothetical protein [Spirochaetaceae bacterium]
MKTKRLFLFGLSAFLLALSLGLAGCDDVYTEPKSISTGGGGGTSGGETSVNLVGTWRRDITADRKDILYFSPTSEWQRFGTEGTDSGIYTYSGNTVKLFYNELIYRQATISGKTLSFGLVEPEIYIKD